MYFSLGANKLEQWRGGGGDVHKRQIDKFVYIKNKNKNYFFNSHLEELLFNTCHLSNHSRLVVPFMKTRFPIFFICPENQNLPKIQKHLTSLKNNTIVSTTLLCDLLQQVVKLSHRLSCRHPSSLVGCRAL